MAAGGAGLSTRTADWRLTGPASNLPKGTARGFLATGTATAGSAVAFHFLFWMHNKNSLSSASASAP